MLVGLSFVWTLFLFFIDEGRYSLQGIEEPGNALAMSIYFIGILAGHITVALLSKGSRRYWVSSLLGWIPGILFGVMLIHLPGLLIRLG